jgi:predicted TIM-barrel fold metal-dependent hydrolase
MGGASRADVLISADAHVGETTDLRARLPEALRRHVPLLVPNAIGDLDVEVEGESFPFGGEGAVVALSDRDKEREFRTDPSYGTDLDRRMRDMAREDVRAQVVFPNISLDCGGGTTSAEYAVALASAYNDFVSDVFSAEPMRFKPAGMIPLDDVAQAVAEATRCIERGFATIFLPCVVPWQPYRLDVYEPLWSLLAEAGIPISFHVFSGNLAFGGEFSDASGMSPERLERARKVGPSERKGPEELETVSGMAAGMAPILELTGSGVLERHPDLRFVITEAEWGWLPWVLQAMDQMQKRRHLYRKDLPLRASEYFQRQGAITITDDAVALRNLESIGSDSLLWGNDFPHDEGTWPDSGPIVDSIRESLGPDRAHAVLAGNAARIYGFDLDYLAANPVEWAS